MNISKSGGLRRHTFRKYQHVNNDQRKSAGVCKLQSTFGFGYVLPSVVITNLEAKLKMRSQPLKTSLPYKIQKMQYNSAC